MNNVNTQNKKFDLDLNVKAVRLKNKLNMKLFEQFPDMVEKMNALIKKYEVNLPKNSTEIMNAAC